MVDEALVDTEDRTLFFYASELHRLRGELLLGVKDKKSQKQAEPSFRQALTVAREQGAKLLELRATTSLARFLRDRGDRNQASTLAQKVTSEFINAEDVPDLREARELIESLELN